MADLDQPVAPRQRRDVIAAAATVAVLLVIGLAFVVSRSDDRGPDRSATGSASSERTGPHPCAGGDLVAGGSRLETAAGTTYLTATLELAKGVEPCSVEGFPVVVLLSDDRPAGVATVPDDGLGPARRLVVLPDRSVRVTLAWAVSHYCGPVDNDAIRFWIASDLPLEVPGFGPTSCNPGEDRPPARVGPFTYVDPTAELGTVHGVVTLNGGPALGTGQYVTAGLVEFDGRPDDYDAPIGPDGSYELELPAGRYQVTVVTRQWYGGTPYPAGPFEVTGNDLSELNLTLPVR